MTAASDQPACEPAADAARPMRVVCEPALGTWGEALPRTINEQTAADRAEVFKFAFEPLRRRPAELDVSRPVIATGHQCQLWHPGILAKLLAARAGAERHNAQPLHLIVDHDAHPATTLELPRRDGDRLATHTLRLGTEDVHTPTGYRQPIEPGAFIEALDEASEIQRLCLPEAHLQALRAAMGIATKNNTPTKRKRTLPGAGGDGWMSLGDQWTGLAFAVLESVLGVPGAMGGMGVLRSSQLLLTGPGRQLVRQMVDEAPRCVRAYNAAAMEHAEAGVPPLIEHRNWVELPLWHLSDGRRHRVWVDRTDSHARLVDETLTPIEPELFHPAPRALLLSAFMRAFVCDRFVHGTGGRVYDRATEAWWRAWHDRPLMPNAVVTADVYLAMPEVPEADAHDLARARWRAHHAPHNVDRLLGLEDELSRRKRELLDHMDDDRDKARRAAAFREVHRVNEQLRAAHPEVTREAERELTRAETGRHNRGVLARRDWPFVAYPPEQLARMAERVAE